MALESSANLKNICAGNVHFYSFDDIYSLFCYELQELSKQSRASFHKLAHQSHARQTVSVWQLDFLPAVDFNKGTTLNTVVQPECLLCSCPCQVKIMQTATQFQGIMSIQVANLHSMQNHVQDKANCLIHQQRSLIANVVKATVKHAFMNCTS